MGGRIVVRVRGGGSSATLMVLFHVVTIAHIGWIRFGSIRSASPGVPHGTSKGFVRKRRDACRSGLGWIVRLEGQCLLVRLAEAVPLGIFFRSLAKTMREYVQRTAEVKGSRKQSRCFNCREKLAVFFHLLNFSSPTDTSFVDDMTRRPGARQLWPNEMPPFSAALKSSFF